MNTIMEFPDTPEQFLDKYSFTDTKEYYTNGQRCISLYRVEQMLEHYFAERTCEMFQYRNALGLIDEYHCSECGADVEGKPNYCPSCGAKVVEYD